jgi:CheY-specific phosphatase CheX
MRESELRLALAESVEETLEKMFFIAGLQEPDPAALPALDVGARVPFRGTPSGCFTLKLTGGAARAMASDFLGGEASPGNVREVVCELANMICGAALSRAKNSGEFRLATPEWLQEAGARREDAIVHAVEIGGGFLEAAVEMEAASCPADERLES